MDRPNAARALVILGKAVETRQSSIGSGLPPTWSRTLGEVQSALQTAAERGTFSARVGEGGLYVGSELALEETAPGGALPAVLLRDRVLELEFSRGLHQNEVGALIDAAALTTEFYGIGDDAYTRLWRLELPHVRALPNRGNDASFEEEIRSVLGEIFGEQAAPSKEALAGALMAESPSPMGQAPGRLRMEIHAELEGLGAEAKLSLAAEAAAEAFTASLPPADVDEIFRGTVELFDALLARQDLVRAADLLRAAKNARAASERVDLFLEEALTEQRTRQVLAIHKNLQSEETFKAIVDFFRGLGSRAAPLILHLMPSLVEPDQRRQLSDIALEVGGLEIDRLRTLISSDLPFVVQEGMYLVARMGTPESESMLKTFETSPRGDVRAALAEAIDTIGGERGLQLGETLLKDPEVLVRIRAAHALARMNDKNAARIIENAVHGPSFEAASLEQKKAFFEAYAVSNQLRALLTLSKHMKKADGLLVKKEVEDLGVAAVEAMRHIPTPRTIEFLKEAAVMKNKRVRDTAREVLQRFKERSQ